MDIRTRTNSLKEKQKTLSHLKVTGIWVLRDQVFVGVAKEDRGKIILPEGVIR